MTRLPTSSSIPIASLLSQTPSPLSFIYASHSRWPLPPHAGTSSLTNKHTSITVLDSSFNPPHAAHKALGETANSETGAQLLTFSLSNADKQLDKKDLHHRLEMVRAMALDLNRGNGGVKHKWNNVAVAVLDAATFVKKSEILNKEITRLLREEHGAEEDVKPEFVFPVGWDTVIRIFAPRYYPPPGPDLSTSMETFLSTNRSSLICARRGNGEVSHQEEEEFLSTPEVNKWVQNGKLKLVDLEEESVRGISSTAIRKAVKEGDWEKVNEMVPFPSVIEVIKREQLFT
ncbi:nicotinamide-nucleotide adenylyltransferase [Sporobolomyces salmoneus]|uniref:nicotinamide-nucleotide adenylyltransferase n=1 Tax=Sporobolomyces salmoneus TaxID=183962 RepID=UPI003171200B